MKEMADAAEEGNDDVHLSVLHYYDHDRKPFYHRLVYAI